MSDSKILKLLYTTAPGRLALKALVNPLPSKAAGAFLDSPASKPFIKPFMRSNGITMDGVIVPAGGFGSFNSFFTRRKHVSFPEEKTALCSPCEGFLSWFTIDELSRFDVKNTTYSLSELLGDDDLAERFRGGAALIFRLTPANFHRYSFFDSGEIIRCKKLPGKLHCVRPVATDIYPVYIQNAREYTILNTDNFGTAIQMEVGALFVGRIVNHPPRVRVERGDEKGYFEFGGSTIILLLEKGTAEIALPSGGTETPVNIGEKIGTKITD